jgi:peptide/nickel transport system permease protein
MSKYIIRRLLVTFFVLVAVSIGTFSLIHLAPGDPIEIMMAGAATNVNVDQIRQQLGLNDPLPVQYFHYMERLMEGDLGRSLLSRRPVLSEFLERFHFTAILAFSSILLALVFGGTIGIISGARPNSKLDYLTMVGAILGISIPSFWLGLMLIFLFAIRLGWLPAAGAGSIQNLILPSITLAAPTTAIIARLTRSSLINVMGEDYIRTARSKGLTFRGVIFKHALRNSLIPVVTVIGLQFGNLIGGAVITETVFAWPGIGRFLVDSILARDFPIVQGFVLFLATGFVIINFLIDILYTMIDPRIRIHES